MAMLAERKKKSKYRLQPFSGLSKINKRCDGDTSSFGFKLMASMGWAPGKGLGRDESGNVDPIKLRLKNDDAGLGYKVSEEDAVAQQSEFQALLLQLNSSAVGEEGHPEDLKKSKKIKSLEKQSEQSSVRVHYKKFTRGKDLSRASDKDLKSILGMSSKTPQSKEPAVKVPKFVNKIPEVHEGNMYITSGSSVDYFKKKYQEKKQVKDLLCQGDDMNEEDYNKRRSVSWGDVDVSYVEKYIKDMVDTSGSANDSLLKSEQEEECQVEPVKKKKKKKRKYEQLSTEVSETNNEEIASPEIENDRRKTKKRTQSKEDSSKENLIQEHEDCNVPKKKKKRKINLADQDGKHNVDTNIEVHHLDTEALCPEEPTNFNVDSGEVPKKKNKKKKKNQVSALTE